MSHSVFKILTQIEWKEKIFIYRFEAKTEQHREIQYLTIVKDKWGNYGIQKNTQILALVISTGPLSNLGIKHLH
jgi:hypothetical protein